MKLLLLLSKLIRVFSPGTFFLFRACQLGLILTLTWLGSAESGATHRPERTGLPSLVGNSNRGRGTALLIDSTDRPSNPNNTLLAITILNFRANPDPVCEGQQITFTAELSNPSGASYSYVLKGLANGNNLSGGGGSGKTFQAELRAVGSGPKTYTLIISDYVTTTSAQITLMINAQPTAFSVTGSGDKCVGGAGMTIDLAGSQSEVSYQLLRDNKPVGESLDGTGDALVMGHQTLDGTYTVLATRLSTGCQLLMPGSVILYKLPVATLISSGVLVTSPAGVTLTAGGGASYAFSGPSIVSQNGNKAIVNSPGLYSVIVTSATGCSSSTSVTVAEYPVPDLTPVLYARPTTLYGTTPVSIVVDIIELNGGPTSGPITLKITQDNHLTLSLPASATQVDGRTVTNSEWQLSGPADGYYILTTNQPIAAGDQLSVGLTGTFSPAASSGALSVSCTLISGSGGEQKLNNNYDADLLFYPQP